MEKPNIIWFMIDSLRNDFLNEFGADTERTFIDDLISEGAAFTNCHTAAPFTIVSMGAKITGCLPSRNGLDGWLLRDPMKSLDSRCLTIIDILKYNGYYNTLYCDSPYGVYLPGDCFDVYHTQEGYNDFPIESYVGHKGPKFIYLCTDIIHDTCCEKRNDFTEKDYKEAVKKTAVVLKGYYDLIKSDNDLILITSDHGIRCQGDFNGNKYAAEYTTGRYLTEKTTRNSFNIIWKDFIPSVKVNQLCRTIDIFPTLFDILGFEYPPVDGVSLKPTLEGRAVNINYTYTVTGWSETHPKGVGAWCVKDNQYKLVEYEELRGFRKKTITSLYNYITDKEEERDLSNQLIDKTEELKRERDKMILNKRAALDSKEYFDYNKYYAVRNKNSQSAQKVQSIIDGVWKKETRKTFLKRYYKSEIIRIIYYYFYRKMLYKY